MKIKIKKFTLISFAYPSTAIEFNLDDYNDTNRSMLCALFNPSLKGHGLKIEDMSMLLTLKKLSSFECKIITGLKNAMIDSGFKSQIICRVTCDWEYEE